MHPDGSTLELDSSSYDLDPSISYDGSKVVVARGDPAAWSSNQWATDLYVINADGTGLKRVASGGPDGKVSGMTRAALRFGGCDSAGRLSDGGGQDKQSLPGRYRRLLWYRSGCQSDCGFCGGFFRAIGSHFRQLSSISSSSCTSRTIAQLDRYRSGGFALLPRSRRRSVAIEIPVASANSIWLMPRSVRSRASRVACFDRDWRRRGTAEPYRSASVY